MKYTKNTRINVRTIHRIPEGGGVTLRYGKPISYSCGWQVGTHGVECHTPEEVSKVIHSGESASPAASGTKTASTMSTTVSM